MPWSMMFILTHVCIGLQPVYSELSATQLTVAHSQSIVHMITPLGYNSKHTYYYELQISHRDVEIGT